MVCLPSYHPTCINILLSSHENILTISDFQAIQHKCEVRYTMYGVLCTIYYIWCMVYNVWCIVHDVFCIVYNVWCILYSMLCMVI